jgi:NADH dehydrogenase [ubiquinone] 1 alpha subcomplex assembly factor 1
VVLLPLGCGTPRGGEAQGADPGAGEERGEAEEVTVTETDRETGVEVRADFAQADEVREWGAVNDVVMGGVSSSSIRASGEGTAVFSGEVSLENDGGFASVRSRPRDGKSYTLNLRTDDAFDGVTWQAAFATRAGEWETVRIGFEELEPRWRGRVVRDAGELAPGRVRTLGLLISDKQEGPFRLEVDWIGSWR